MPTVPAMPGNPLMRGQLDNFSDPLPVSTLAQDLPEKPPAFDADLDYVRQKLRIVRKILPDGIRRFDWNIDDGRTKHILHHDLGSNKCPKAATSTRVGPHANHSNAPI
jgi:hypothetical protein